MTPQAPSANSETSIEQVLAALRAIAPENLAEDFDNAGLILGDPNQKVTAVLCCLEIDDFVFDEAVSRGCNLIVAHHPLIFKPIKRLIPGRYPDRIVSGCIRHGIAVYAFHTAFDKVESGVSGVLARVLGLRAPRVLRPELGGLFKLEFYAPEEAGLACLNVLFEAGFGTVGKYSECSFSTRGIGTFKPLPGSSPFSGQIGQRSSADEVCSSVLIRAEQIAPALRVLHAAHPYEEVAYQIVPLQNADHRRGLGMIGALERPMDREEFLDFVNQRLGCSALRYNSAGAKRISRVAVCGGSGAFLVPDARSAAADALVTADLKHHDFFEAESLLLVDAGHARTEEPALRDLAQRLRDLFPNFAVLFPSRSTDPTNFRFNSHSDVHDQRVSE